MLLLEQILAISVDPTLEGINCSLRHPGSQKIISLYKIGGKTWGITHTPLEQTMGANSFF